MVAEAGDYPHCCVCSSMLRVSLSDCEWERCMVKLGGRCSNKGRWESPRFIVKGGGRDWSNLVGGGR